jgi:ABC-2 type transport system ATP-binding protein
LGAGRIPLSLIEVNQVFKEFCIARKQPGIFASTRALFNPKYEIRSAVNGISFSIQPGEMVGFIGPNGAGKSTTIKMLTGILVPTSGDIHVLGHVPHKHRELNAANIGVVFGQRTQLWWDLPLIDSFELLKYVFKLPQDVYMKNLNFLSELLEVNAFINTPVRQLSLGQRMRGDLLAALLHDPAILFLDEPTIGLDAIAKETIRNLLVQINKERKVSVLLSTHDMIDIEKTCKRMIIIDKGSLVYDGGIDDIRANYGKTRKLIVDFKYTPQFVEMHDAQVIEQDGLRYSFSFDKDRISASELITRVSLSNEVADLTIEETDIDAIIKEIYQSNAKVAL